MRVLCRPDAGPTAGLGHLQRCLSLAEALRQQGSDCVFLAPGHPAVQRRIAAAGCASEPLEAEAGSGDPVTPVLRAAERFHCDVVVVDSYALSAEELGRLRAGERFVVAIDDLAREPFPCQLVVNGGVHAPRLAYRSSSGDTQFLIGPRFAMLRSEFRRVPPRPARSTGRSLLLMMGGADPRRLTPELVRALASMSEDLDISAVIGPLADSREEVERASRACRRPVRLFFDASSVCDLMREADLAVSAAGQTLYELAAVGCPTVAMCVADNQEAQWHAFAEAGVVRQAGRAGEPGLAAAVVEAVRGLLADAPARLAMSSAGRALVDGLGSIRVSAALIAAAQTSPAASPSRGGGA